MLEISLNPSQISGFLFSIRGLVITFGNIALVVAAYFVFEIFDTVRANRGLELPSFQEEPLSDAEGNGRLLENGIENYQIILQRNIFGAIKDTPATSTTTPTTQKTKLRLVGTNVSSTGNSFAIIENLEKKTQDVFDLNQDVFGQGKLTKILRESIEITRGNDIETVLLEEAQSKGGDSGLSSNEDGTEFSVAEDELSQALANLPQLLSQARAVPYFKNGESVGMRLFAIRRGSLYEKLGLKNGDIIRSVNDNSLTDASQAVKIFEQLKSERNIAVSLERAGAEKTLRYTVR